MKARRKKGSPWWTSVLFCAGPDGTCWEWTACLMDCGYGRMNVSGRLWLTHRLVYEQFRGQIPHGLDLDHLCRNRACCNPSHLEPVTRNENVARGVSCAAIPARTGHCKRGHAIEGTNVYVATKTGKRRCKECKLENTRRWYREQKQ